MVTTDQSNVKLHPHVHLHDAGKIIFFSFLLFLSVFLPLTLSDGTNTH